MNTRNGLQERESFSSSFGLIAAAVGSAVGLGNIWRFPYIVGQYGGGAFLIVYLLFVAIIGIPIMMSEFVVGREARKDASGSYKALAKKGKWHISGGIGIAAAFIILGFYGVIAGWTLESLFGALTNRFSGQSAAQIGDHFSAFISHPIKPLFWQFLFMGITGFIVATGVEEGIERSAKILIPALVAIVVALGIRSVTLPGAREGLEFLFKPDFSLLTKEGVLAALGHSFFSLSLGMAIMVTYGSYMNDDEKIASTAVKISLADVGIALLAGIAIFPAVFAFGIAPDSGPSLVFITLPNVFSQMPGGYIFAILFFGLLALAALTSTMSLLEAVVSFAMERFSMERVKSTIIVTVLITAVGAISSLSNGPLSFISIFGNNIFDFLDFITANYFLPIAALIGSVFVGWRLDKNILQKQLSNAGTLKAGYIGAFRFVVRFIVPIAILIVFLSGLGVF